jgi:hypothetical protein
MQATSLINATEICGRYSFIDWRIRRFVARQANLANLANAYVTVSVVTEFLTCLGKVMTPACNNNLLCDIGQGAITYGARASVLKQDVLGRATLGQANKLAYSYFKFSGAPVFIETLEPMVVEIIKKVGGYQENLASIMSNMYLGMKVGLLCLFYGSITSYVPKMTEGDQTMGTNTTEYYNESLSTLGQDGQALGSQEMCLLGEE